MGREKLRKQRSGRLIETLKMERVRTILTHRYPYPHEHSRHLMIAVFAIWLFFVSSDNLQTLIMKLDKNFKWWSMYIAWIFLAALYHLPSFQSMGLDLRMNLSLFLTIYISSLIFLIVFHVIFLGLWYLGLVSRMAEKKPEMLTIIQNCAVISIACCVLYSHCGNKTITRDKSIDRRTASWVAFSLWKKHDDNSLISKLLRMHKFKEQICSSWFAPVGSASDYPLLSKWAIYEEKRSYFALKLPNGWWVFGLDQALHGDIDVYQFKFFAELCQQKVGESDSVILITHEPNWLLDWYWGDKTGTNVEYLIREYLKGRCKLRMAGDLHHYMRHSFIESKEPVHVQHLLVNGCGGAFLHPTHVFENFREFYGNKYETKIAYPSYDDSSKIALGNILKFRRKNWQFDVIGGFVYFVLVFSMFPQCDSFRILREDSWADRVNSFFTAMWNVVFEILEHSYVSLAGVVTLLMVSFFFVPTKLSRRRRALLGFLHAVAHLTSAVILMLLMELAIEICIRNNLLATSGYHTLYEWYRKVESEHFPDPTGLRTRLEQWTLGLYPACIKYLMSAFDIPEVMAVTRSTICRKGIESLPRGGAIIYYVCVFLYFWVLSTPVVSLVFGSYLYICINWFHIHFDEAFSSLRIANYKAFTRFHIKKNGDLEVFTFAVDKVPKDWMLDPDWDMEPKEPFQMSYTRKFPSKWRAASGSDPTNAVRIVDHFVIPRTPPDSPTSGSAS
uniref:Calcineurin-like phosphoesterase domain-containing protein n=1 Tax=Oryza rufipogon TaxID=4529 RepID=A0A0E0Q3R7_ORYRU